MLLNILVQKINVIQINNKIHNYRLVTKWYKLVKLKGVQKINKQKDSFLRFHVCAGKSLLNMKDAQLPE